MIRKKTSEKKGSRGLIPFLWNRSKKIDALWSWGWGTCAERAEGKETRRKKEHRMWAAGSETASSSAFLSQREFLALLSEKVPSKRRVRV